MKVDSSRKLACMKARCTSARTPLDGGLVAVDLHNDLVQRRVRGQDLDPVLRGVGVVLVLELLA